MTSAFASAAAAEVASYRIPGLPLLSGLGTVDDLGRAWELTGEKGWLEGPAPRTNRGERTDADGSYRSVSYSGELVFTVRGTVNVGARPDLLERTRLEIVAACSPGRGLYTVRRAAGDYDHTREAERDAALELEYVGRYDIDFQYTFAAPDPRAHDYRWQEPRASPPAGSAPVSGLDDTGGGLTDAGGGLDDYVPAGVNDPLVAMVANYGNADAWPFLELRGEQPPCSIVRDETGDELRYLGYVGAGETVWINCDDFAAAAPGRPYIPGRTAISSARGDVTSLLIARSWPQVVCQDVATFRLLGVGPPESLTVALRSAYR